MALSETDHTLLPGVSGNMLMTPGYHTRMNKEGTVLNHSDNIQHRRTGLFQCIHGQYCISDIFFIIYLYQIGITDHPHHNLGIF